MSAARHVAVLDIGKTNVKLALVDRARLVEVAVRTRPNRVRPGPPWPHFDTEAIWRFLLDGLAELQAEQPVDAIAVTTHGAAAAWLTADGALAAPILDYEHDGPQATRADYDALRPPFEETGSPALPLGLNLGAQLFWQMRQDRDLVRRAAWLVTYPQYWGARLTGQAACDVASLGCHTDLWAPSRRAPSALVGRLGLEGLLAPTRRPGEVLGPILPEVATRTGLDPSTPVMCGIHDSNASLLPHLMTRTAPFSVVSSGTWVIAMAIGGRKVALDEARDALINVDASGAPVPSARFMGGREYALARGEARAMPEEADLAAVLSESAMLLPAIEASSGPFRGRASRSTHTREALGERRHEAVVSFYLALMAAECLALIGAEGATVVEGPLASNEAYLRMLVAATGRPVIRSRARTGTSLGAALLAPGPAAQLSGEALDDRRLRAEMAAYAKAWRMTIQVP